MNRIVATALIAGAAFAATAPTVSAGDQPSPAEICSMPGMVGSDIENDFFPKTGGCVSSVATGGLETGIITPAGYNQRCKQLEGLFGGYPMIFEHGERIDIANNKKECAALLEFFHSGGLGAE